MTYLRPSLCLYLPQHRPHNRRFTHPDNPHIILHISRRLSLVVNQVFNRQVNLEEFHPCSLYLTRLVNRLTSLPNIPLSSL